MIDNGHTVAPDGVRLKQDRRSKRVTQEALAMEAAVSLSTVARAEAGARISRHSLKSLAAVLGHPPDKYAAANNHAPLDSSVPVLDGEWTSFYVEDDIKTEPYIVEEYSVLKSNNGLVSAVFETRTPKETRTEYLHNGKQIRSVFVGSTTIEGWVLPAGYAQFQLLCLRNDDWMDGVVTWYDSEVVSSRYIWIRNDSRLFDEFMKIAGKLMQEEKRSFKERRLAMLKQSIAG